MTHIWLASEHLLVESDTTGKPASFRWRGRRHRVERIVQTWEVVTDWWESGDEIRRTYHALITCGSLFCVLYHDHISDGWHLAKTYD